MQNQTIANLSVLESLQTAANERMNCGDLGVFNDRERVENGSGGLQHLRKKLAKFGKQLQEEEPLSAEREDKAIQVADLVLRVQGKKHSGEKRAKVSGNPIWEPKGKATIADCLKSDTDLSDD